MEESYLNKIGLQGEIPGMKSFRHPTNNQLIGIVLSDNKTIHIVDEVIFRQSMIEGEKTWRVANQFILENPYENINFVVNSIVNDYRPSINNCLLKIGDSKILVFSPNDSPRYIHIDRMEASSEELQRLLQLAIDICFPNRPIRTNIIEDNEIVSRIKAEKLNENREKQKYLLGLIREFESYFYVSNLWPLIVECIGRA